MTILEGSIHPELTVYLEDETAKALFWELVKRDPEGQIDLLDKIEPRVVGSWTTVQALHRFHEQGCIPGKGLGIVDGDQRDKAPECLSLPGDKAPEEQVFFDLKEHNWGDLDNRFGNDSSRLSKCFNDAMLPKNHHLWIQNISDRIKKPKDVVWNALIEEWRDKCLSEEDCKEFVNRINMELQS